MALGLTPSQIIEKAKHPLLCKHDTWERVNLELVAKVQNGFAFKSEFFNFDNGLPLIRIRDIESDKTENLYSGQFDEQFIVRKDDILIGMDGDFKAAKWRGKDALLNQRVCRIIVSSRLIDEKFLFICLQPFLNAINAETSSVTVKHLSSRTIQEIPLPLPPLSEQKRIVEKIEELFSELDKGIESLKTAREQLKIYRQSVLKHAFEGKLTENWRKENNIPFDWGIEVLGSCGKWTGGGTPSKSVPIFWENGDVLWITPKDMKTRFISDTIQKITKGSIEHSSAKLIESEAVLFVVRSGILRRILPIAISPAGSTVNQDMVSVMPNKHEIKFLYWFCEANEREIRNTCSKDGTTVESIEVAALKRFKTPVPSIKEQNEIVRLIEEKMSQIDFVEETIDAEINKSEALRQSILKSAFSGKLVAHDPNDEPASVLLERIKSERDSNKRGKQK